MGSVFKNHSQEHPVSFSPGFCKFECNTTADWLNRMVLNRMVENKTTNVLKNGW